MLASSPSLKAAMSLFEAVEGGEVGETARLTSWVRVEVDEKLCWAREPEGDHSAMPPTSLSWTRLLLSDDSVTFAAGLPQK